MQARTRYFMIASLLVVGVGVGAGLVAYYVGLPTSAAGQSEGLDDLQFVPRGASLIAFVDVQDVMVSDLRQRLLRALPQHQDGQQEFENQTGINIETDIDRVMAAMLPPHQDGEVRASGLVLARGRFDVVKIEALMRQHGASVDEYRDVRIVSGDRQFSVAFLEPGLTALGHTAVVRRSVDLRGSADNVLADDEIMNLVRSIDGSNAWAVGRFDALTEQARLPQDVARQLPTITWFTASAQVNGGIRGIVRAEALNEEAATGLRDVVTGLLAFARLQTASRPEVQTLLQSVELGGVGTTVALSFDLSGTVLDALLPSRQSLPPNP